MELLVLAMVALALVLTFSIIALKLLWMAGKLFVGVLLLPFKLAGGLAGGIVQIAFLPLGILAGLFLLVGAVMGLALLPVILPLLLIGLGVALLARAG